MATPLKTLVQRQEEKARALQMLVDAGSPSVVRCPVLGSAISGARRRYPLPSIGHRSGHLTVTGYIQGVRNGVRAVIVRCDCGRPEYTVDCNCLKAKLSTRCSICGNAAGARKRYWAYVSAMADDIHRTRLLNRLSAAISRCHNPGAKQFDSYGARGIRVCDAWRQDRAAFLRYAQTLPGWDDPSLDMDRENTDGNYEPGNVRFVTRAINARNKRQVNALEARVRALEVEITHLRLRLLRAERAVHGDD